MSLPAGNDVYRRVNDNRYDSARPSADWSGPTDAASCDWVFEQLTRKFKELLQSLRYDSVVCFVPSYTDTDTVAEQLRLGGG